MAAHFLPFICGRAVTVSKATPSVEAIDLPRKASRLVTIPPPPPPQPPPHQTPPHPPSRASRPLAPRPGVTSEAPRSAWRARWPAGWQAARSFPSQSFSSAAEGAAKMCRAWGQREVVSWSGEVVSEIDAPQISLSSATLNVLPSCRRDQSTAGDSTG